MNANALPINQGTEPVEGRKSWTSQWDFTQSLSYNRTLILTDIGMPSGIQSIFIDNSNSPSILILTQQGSAQKLVVPAYSQMISPVLNVGQNFGYSVSCAGNVAVPFQLFNFEQELSVVNAQGTQVAGTVQVNGSVVTSPSAGAFTDRSGTIQTAAQSQNLILANGARRRFLILNPASTAGQFLQGSAGYANGTLESLFFNFTQASSPNDGVSIELQPGGSFDTGGGVVSTELITGSAATGGHRYIAKEM